MSNNKELNWLISHPEVEQKYVGEYIAISEKGILSHSKDFNKVLKEIEKSGKKSFIHKVPPTDKELIV